MHQARPWRRERGARSAPSIDAGSSMRTASSPVGLREGDPVRERRRRWPGSRRSGRRRSWPASCGWTGSRRCRARTPSPASEWVAERLQLLDVHLQAAVAGEADDCEAIRLQIGSASAAAASASATAAPRAPPGGRSPSTRCRSSRTAAVLQRKRPAWKDITQAAPLPGHDDVLRAEALEERLDEVVGIDRGFQSAVMRRTTGYSAVRRLAPGQPLARGDRRRAARASSSSSSASQERLASPRCGRSGADRRLGAARGIDVDLDLEGRSGREGGPVVADLPDVQARPEHDQHQVGGLDRRSCRPGRRWSPAARTRAGGRSASRSCVHAVVTGTPRRPATRRKSRRTAPASRTPGAGEQHRPLGRLQSIERPRATCARQRRPPRGAVAPAGAPSRTPGASTSADCTSIGTSSHTGPRPTVRREPQRLLHDVAARRRVRDLHARTW